MESLPPRQLDILEITRIEGRVDVESLAERFAVSAQTIRKDLNDLCSMDKLHRVHGGAVLPSNTVNLEYHLRRTLAAQEKSWIASQVAAIIPDDSSLILNIGTTTEQVAYALRHHKKLMVITNSLNVALILSEVPSIELIVTGGMVRKSDGGIVGSAAVDLIRQFKVDCAVVGASAIDNTGALLDFDYREVTVAKAILEQARKRILVADHTKFDRRAPVQIGHISDIDVFITDQSPPSNIARICNDADVQIIVSNVKADDLAKP